MKTMKTMKLRCFAIQQFSPALLAFWLCAICHLPQASAATFPGNARIEVADSTGALSWKTDTAGLTVSCWFKIVIPSGTNVTENMTILVNRRTGSETDPHAYLIRLNVANGNIEFSTKGSLSTYVNTLIERPFLDRWYNVAVVRQSDTFAAYVDGRQVFTAFASVGNAGNGTDGVSIGGWANAKHFYGEVQEVAIYQTVLSQEFIATYLFQDQPASDPSLGLKGYFKLGYSTNAADNLKNFATQPVPAGTENGTKQGSGNIEFEQTDEAGEQSAFDAQRNGGRDALTPLSGAFSWEQTALARPTPGIAFDFRLGYSSANAFGGYKLGSLDPYSVGPVGRGWRHSFQTRVISSQNFTPLADTDTLGLMLWNGAIETWDRDLATGEYRPRSKQYNGELLLTLTNCQWTTPERLVYIFKSPDKGPAVMRGYLLEIRDFNSNSVRVLWNEISGVLTQVVDSAGGRYAFNQDARALLTNITFGNWSVNLTYDLTNRLIAKTLTNSSGLYTNVNTAWQFAYNATNGLLERVTDPRNNSAISIVYDRYGRKIEQRDALSQLAKTEYAVPAKRQMRQTDPANLQWIETFDRKGRLLAQRDPLANETRYTYDEFGNQNSITEPLGWTTFVGYDDRANVVARTNALGEIARWTIHPFFNKAIQQITPQPLDAKGWITWTNFYAHDARGNLTNHSDALGSLVRYTYGTNGLVLTATDANGNVTRMAYDTNGFLVARTDPSTNTTRFGYNDVGRTLAATNALGFVTRYGLDLNGNVLLIQDPLQRVFLRTVDPNGNLLTTTDGKGQLTRHAYDPANQRTQTVDRASFTWSYAYSSRGKLDKATDPLANIVQSFYDDANRLVRVADPLGNSVTNVYDANGNLVAFFDKLGQRSTKTYDRLNRAVAESDPLGNTRQTSYDIAGRIQQITTASGYPTLHSYDGRGRLAKWHDAEGFDWLYGYDGVGNITNITDALGGHYVMAYGNRNDRILERNQDGFEWRYTYDELVRPKIQRDPNGITRTLAYDDGGRLLTVTFNTGRVNSFSYDENDNPWVLSRTGSGPPTISQLDYDARDLVTEYRDAFGKRVKYAYDGLGRATALTYPDGKVLARGYDPLSRLTNQVLQFSAQARFTNSYTYDKAGRLIARSYPNGLTENIDYDNASRLTNLVYQTFGTNTQIALTYAYDRNGNKTGSTEKGTFEWPLPSLAEEKARYTPSGRLIDRTISQLPATNSPQAVSYQYDPSGNMTNAAGVGQTWALAYDEDNRVTSISWDSGLTAKAITNRYDALGRRVAKTVDGVQSAYVLDLAGGMERVLCDLNQVGAFTAWYVHGLDLCYKVAPDGSLTCYHSDAQGNIIALTGDSGTNLALYAYTPYGRSLGSTNSQSQISNPYLFVGSQGVMEELPGLYFMRARYYSADAGVFLSTDPVKKIGAGWKPVAYGYANGNPGAYIDPNGEVIILVVIGVVLAADYLLEWADLPIADADNTLKLRTGQMSKEQFQIQRASEIVDVIPGNKLWDGVKLGAGVAKAMNSGDWLSIVPVVGPIRSINEHIDSMGNTVRQTVNSSEATSKISGGGGGATSGMANKTPAAANNATVANAGQSQPSASPGNQSSSTSSNSGTKPAGSTATPPSTGSGSTSSSATSITIPSGATLSGLASKNGTTVSKLMALNPQIKNANLIYAGQTLKIK